MSKRDPQILVADVRLAIEKIERYLTGLNHDQFLADDLRKDAVARNLEIIGEAVRQMPEGFRQAHADVPWQQIAGLRNRIVHDYFGLDWEIIWHVTQTELAVLKAQLPKDPLVVGSGEFRYRVAVDWPHWPDDWNMIEVVGVATDSQDRAFVLSRGEHPVTVFDREGRFLSSWGEGLFLRPHGITVAPDDTVFCTDDFGHTVRQFTTDGKLLMTLGTHGQPSDTGATSIDYRTIRHAGPPFHFPTNVALAPSGELFISDGYGNARIHKFTAEGRLLHSWGEPGTGPGQFQIPHGIAIDRQGTVYVADRENSRLQLFSPDGDFLTEWPDIARPCEVAIDNDGRVFVAEVGYRAGMWPGTIPPHLNATGGRVSIFDSRGQLLARWGGGDSPCAPGDFFAPHDIWFDSRGDLYVSEVVRAASGNVKPPVGDYHTLQKFERLPS